MREFNYVVDFYKINERIRQCMQDDTVKIVMSVFENEKAFNLEGKLISFEFLKPNDKIVSITGDRIKVINNTIEVDLKEDGTNIAGTCIFTACIKDQKGVVRAFPMYLVVTETVTNGKELEGNVISITKELTDKSFEVLETKAKLDESIRNGDTKKMRDDIDINTSQLDNIPKKEGINYFVGASQKYKTITSAYNQWASDGRPVATIWISQGEYNESIRALNLENKLSLIGEDKSKVIWRTKKGYYKDAPLHVCNCYIKNITFIADHTETTDFTYKTLAGASVWVDSVGGAYALHVDFTGVGGKTTIENCDLISYQNCAFGSGTSKDQTIEVINTNMYSYTPSGWVDEVSKNGAMLYHTSATTGQINQSLKLQNVKMFSENYKAFQYEVYANEDVSKLEAINCNFASNTISGNSLVNIKNDGRPYFVTENSFGNNVDSLNKSTNLSLVGTDGHCYHSNNFNNEKIGFFWGHGGQGDLNVPTAAYYICQSISYNDKFIIQFAWSITAQFIRYIRYCNNGVWTTWALSNNNVNDYIAIDNGGVCITVTDSNLATKTGYYQNNGGANIPSDGGAYMLHTISTGNLYKIQYAYKLTTGDKYKRTMINGTWGSWSSKSTE